MTHEGQSGGNAQNDSSTIRAATVAIYTASVPGIAIALVSNREYWWTIGVLVVGIAVPGLWWLTSDWFRDFLKSFRDNWRVYTPVVVVLAVVVAVGGYYIVDKAPRWVSQQWSKRFSDKCIEEDILGKKPTQTPPPASVLSPEKATDLYKKDEAAIEAENERIRRLTRDEPDKKYTVKTVVYLGSGSERFADGVAYNGVIPEMRGIRIAQKKVNNYADQNPRHKDNLNGNVYILVDIQEAGQDYADAPKIARQVVSKSTETVLGVIGLGESRGETLEAQKILGDGGLPMLGMGATSENLQNHPLYRQVSFDNPRQARMFAEFARNANIIHTESAGEPKCTSASHAVIIGDPTDDYSFTLSNDIAAEFDSTSRIWFPTRGRTQPGGVKGTIVTNETDLINKACEELSEKGDDTRTSDHTVLFWAGRAQDLKSFLDSAKKSGTCPSRFTVISGDTSDATVLTKDFWENLGGVTLYHAAHALTSRSPNKVGDEFANDYVDNYGKKDPWYDHWRGPVGYDGLTTMAAGINAVCQENGAAGCGRGSVAAHFRYRIGGPTGIRGATGMIRFVDNPVETASTFPINKRFLMLQETRHGPSVVMECGQRDTGESKTTWGPKDEFECPHT